jgi:hypothetical protein
VCLGEGKGGGACGSSKKSCPWPVSFTHAMSRASFSSSSPPPDDDGYGAVGGDVVLTSAPPSSPNGVAEAAPPPPPPPAPAAAPAAAWSCSIFECFPYVCPEPVLVKSSFIYKTTQKTVLLPALS